MDMYQKRKMRAEKRATSENTENVINANRKSWYPRSHDEDQEAND